MDLEQRIGRIHRYGQQSTAQVYNLVAADTIEGQIFLLLEEKLGDIAETLGKVDDKGQIAEDLRGQVLGQLSSCLKYDSLYKEALDDPSLKRTRQELEVAMSNANLAREVVFELFQDLDHFNLGDYQKYNDDGLGMQRLVGFISRSLRVQGGEFSKIDELRWDLNLTDEVTGIFTTDRDLAITEDSINLVGLEHPIIQELMSKYTSLSYESRAIVGKIKGVASSGILYIWLVQTQGKDAQLSKHIVSIAITEEGERAPWLEKLGEKLLSIQDVHTDLVPKWIKIAVKNKQKIGEILHRDLQYSGIIEGDMTYSSNLLAVYGILK